MPCRPARPARFDLVGALLALAIAAAGCTAPFGSAPQGRASAFPVLLPLEGLLAGAEEGRLTEADGDALLGRAAGLRARAAALEGPVIDAATRERMLAALARPPS